MVSKLNVLHVRMWGFEKTHYMYYDRHTSYLSFHSKLLWWFRNFIIIWDMHWKCRSPVVITFFVRLSVRLSVNTFDVSRLLKKFLPYLFYILHICLISWEEATYCFSTWFHQSFRSYEHFTDLLIFHVLVSYSANMLSIIRGRHPYSFSPITLVIQKL